MQFNPGLLQAGKGSGLGLFSKCSLCNPHTDCASRLRMLLISVTKGIVELHHGTISVYSEGEGYGCTFTLELPVYSNIEAIYRSSIVPSSSLGTNKDIENQAFVVANGSNLSTPSYLESELCVYEQKKIPLATTRIYHSHGYVVAPSPRAASIKLPVATVTSRGSGTAFSSDFVRRFSSKDRGGGRNSVSTIGSGDKHDRGTITELGKSPIYGEFLGPEVQELHHRDSFHSLNGIGAGTGGDDMFKVNYRRVRSIDERSMVGRARKISSIVSTDQSSHVVLASIHDSQPEMSRARVLVVDDASLNRKMLCRLLKDRCGVVHEAENGQVAVDMVIEAMTEDRGYHIVLMDYQMPVMDGPTACRRIRALGYLGIILGVTGSARTEDVESFMTHGANMVFPKPFEISHLDTVISGTDMSVLLYSIKI